MSALPTPSSARTLTVASEAIPLFLGRPIMEAVRLSGSEGVNSLFDYELLMKTPDRLNLGASAAADLNMDDFIGKEISCRIQLDGMGSFMPGKTGLAVDHVGEGTREINAIISDAALWGEEGRDVQYRFTLRPWLYLLTRSVNCRIFQNKTVVQILEEVLGAYPFSMEKRLIDTYPVRDTQTQFCETDFEFFSRLCQEWGISYHQTHSGGHHRLVLVDNMGSYLKMPSEAYQHIEYHAPGQKMEGEYISSFVPHHRLTSGRYTTRDYDYTVILNSSPYRFDNFVTDYLTAANGNKEVQSPAARLNTFVNAAAIVNESSTQFAYKPAPDAACTAEHVPEHIHDDVIFVHQPADNPDWRAEIGAAPVKGELRWWSVPMYKRDNRGKLFVNFNPADRVIGISAVEGIGWRGLPTKYFDAGNNQLGANVMQRVFVRGSTDPKNPADPGVEKGRNPPVGSRTGYKQPYFYSQIERLSVASSDAGVTWKTGSGGAVITDNENWHYMDGSSPNSQWRIASEKILGLVASNTDLSPRGDNGASEYVYINAPLVPEPAVLGDEFDEAAVMFDGKARAAGKNGPAVAANKEQQAAFEEFLRFQDREKAPATKQEISCEDARGLPSTRLETDCELAQRLERTVGQEVVSPTNHAQILRYGKFGGGGTVSQVLSYDLTVGQGYALQDETYWNYLLNLADWKLSDPYFLSGRLDPAAEAMPPGIDPETVSS